MPRDSLDHLRAFLAAARERSFSRAAIRRAALSGLGLAHLPGDRVQADVAEGRLVRVLDEWCEPFPGYHPYYSSRHQHSPAPGFL